MKSQGDGDGDGGWGWGGVEIRRRSKTSKKSSTLLDLCVSSLCRGHANLLCIVPILTDVPRKESKTNGPQTPMFTCYVYEASFYLCHAPRLLPVNVWFSCLENHLCQVEVPKPSNAHWEPPECQKLWPSLTKKETQGKSH